MQLTSALRESGKTFVSASTCEVNDIKGGFATRCYQTAHHEAHFEEIGCDTHQRVDFAEEIKIQRCHPVVVRNARKKVHENQLTVPLATIPGFLVRCSFLLRAAFDKDYGRCTATGDGFIEHRKPH